MKLKSLYQLKRFRWTGSLIAIAVAVLTSLSLFATGPTSEPIAAVEKAWPVSVVYPKALDRRPNFNAFGQLEAARIAQLQSEVVAKIKTVKVSEGEWVAANAVLIELDRSDAELAVAEQTAVLAEARAKLSEAQIGYELAQDASAYAESRFRIAQQKRQRQADLIDRKLIANAEFDDAVSASDQAALEYNQYQTELANYPHRITALKASVTRAEATLAKAQSKLDKTTIRAPFAGPILNVYAAPGEHSSLSAPLLEIAAVESFQVRVPLPEVYHESIRKALSANQPIVAVDERERELRLQRLATQMRQGQSGLDGFFQYDAEQAKQVTLGRVVNVRIEMPAQPDLVALPVPALYQNDRVYRVADNRLIAHQVHRIGEQLGPEGYQILVKAPDLPADSAVITTQLPQAISGLLVSVSSTPEVKLTKSLATPAKAHTRTHPRSQSRLGRNH